MPDNASSDRVADFERTILRALCTRSIDANVWQQIRLRLADYSWREPDHAVVYEAIVRVKARDAKNMLAHLAAQTTRMGFPDLDWTVYLRPIEVSEANIDGIVGMLKAASARGT